MATPTTEDIEKYKAKHESYLKQLDCDGRLLEKHLVSMLRSAVRQSWMRSPTKLACLEEGRVPDLDPKTRTKWLWECRSCKGMFKQADIEVDHESGEWPFTKLDEFMDFCKNVLQVKLDGLQRLCKSCHEIKTYAERYGLTLEQAEKEKHVIKFKKLKAAEQKKVLSEAGVSLDKNNAETRVEAYRNLTKDGVE